MSPKVKVYRTRTVQSGGIAGAFAEMIRSLLQEARHEDQLWALVVNGRAVFRASAPSKDKFRELARVNPAIPEDIRILLSNRGDK